jgi:DNA-binding NarL/FixJ family response regulator
MPRLTRPEQKVLALIAQGMSNKEIVRCLSRSPRTIDHHLSSLPSKLATANRMEVLPRLRGEAWLPSDSDLPEPREN